MRPDTGRLRRILRDLARLRYSASEPLADFRRLSLGVGVPPAETAPPPDDAPGWEAATVGARWGGRDETVWFHGRVVVPASWREAQEERYAIVARVLLGHGSDPDGFGWPEGLLYVNGRLAQGINRHHPDVLLATGNVAANQLTFDARVWSGLLANDQQIESADIAVLDHDAERLYYLLSAGADLVDTLDESAPLTFALAEALDTAADRLDLRQMDAPATRNTTRDTIGEALGVLRARLDHLNRTYMTGPRPEVIALGHGHLDVAWLWQLRHTREKTARTFSIATALMDHYPDYHFLHTTPQVFAWLKTDYPDLYERVKQRVADGRFEAAGAMWLESDCNLVSGESLIRQITHGQRFLREEFGRTCDVLWLPDAFGYTPALPQLMLRAGLRTFVTTKMSWSETNRIPADTFRWRGLDGSSVLAHFITTPSLSSWALLDRTDTYNGTLRVAAVRGAWERYRQKALNHELVLAVGYGDGGAGATRQQVEQLRALQQLPGAPAIRFGRADEYFVRLRERVWERPELPTWDGELYLEYHRGTFTTQAWLKRAHRQLESKLALAEFLDSWLALKRGAQEPDRRATLDTHWQTLLLHEFHDILPGSSIAEVYEDARLALGHLDAALEEMVAAELHTLADTIVNTSGAENISKALFVVNPSPWPRTEIIALPSATATGAEMPLPADSQVTSDGSQLVEVRDIPALGYRMYPLPFISSAADGPREPARAWHGAMENSAYRLQFNDTGEITSLIDKRIGAGREIIQEGQAGNHLQLFDDRPQDFDAWNIDADFERKAFPVAFAEMRVIEDGPLRATTRIAHRMGRSVITQDVSLYRSSARIDFGAHIVWHERHQLLKAAFPLDMRATEATFETQFGSVRRATHRNTSWDQARFEVYAHRWVDLSEDGYGVSLLNDGRYGHDVRDSTLRISLLRGPTYPDPTADQGEHRVTYSLLPHPGDWRAGGTVAEAYALNRPLRVRPLSASSAPPTPDAASASLLSAEPASVVIETVKRAEDGDGLIVRLYEAYGGRSPASIAAAFALASVEECDLLERRLTPETSPSYHDWIASPVASRDTPEVTANGWRCDLRPFEIRTFRVRQRTG